MSKVELNTASTISTILSFSSWIQGQTLVKEKDPVDGCSVLDLLLVLLIKYCAVSFYFAFLFFPKKTTMCGWKNVTENRGGRSTLSLVNATPRIYAKSSGGRWGGLQNEIQGHTMKSRGDIEGPATFKQCNDKFSLAHTKLVHPCQVKPKWGK